MSRAGNHRSSHHGGHVRPDRRHRHVRHASGAGGKSATSQSSPPAQTPASTAAPDSGTVTLNPATLTVTEGVCESITLTWTYSDIDATGFEVELEQVTGRFPATPAENFSLYTNPPVTPVLAPGGKTMTGSYTFFGEASQQFAGNTFKFRVRADRADGTVSDYSNVLTQTATSDVPDLHAAAGKPGTIQLTWNYKDAPVPFIIESRESQTAAWRYLTTISASNGLSCLFTDGLPGVSYAFRVQAAPDHVGPWSNTATAVVPAAGFGLGAGLPSILPYNVLGPKVTITQVDATDIRVSWSSTGGWTSYAPDGTGTYHLDTYAYAVIDWGGSWDSNEIAPSGAPAVWSDGTATNWYASTGHNGTDTWVILNISSETRPFIVQVEATGGADTDQMGNPIDAGQIGWGAAVFKPAPARPKPPAAPAFASATFDTRGRPTIHINWANTSDNEDGYVVDMLGTNQAGKTAYYPLASTGADVTSYTFTPLFNGPYFFEIFSFTGSAGILSPDMRESATSASASCSAIGGPDVTAHLVKIRAQLFKLAATASVKAAMTSELHTDIATYILNNDFWDIVPLAGQTVATPENSALLPVDVRGCSKTVTVAGGVFLQPEVNYWLFGALIAALGLDHNFYLGLVTDHGGNTTEGSAGKAAWFEAGYYGNVALAAPAAIPAVLPAALPKYQAYAPLLHWYVGHFGANQFGLDG